MIGTKNYIQILSNYIEKTKLDNPIIKVNDHRITITNKLLNGNIIADLGILFLIIIFFKQNRENEYAIIAIFFILIFLIFLWIDYNTINIVVIDLSSKILTIETRNIFKKIFQKKKNIKIKEIEIFYIKTTGFGRGQSRYKLKICTKSNEHFSLTDFNQQDEVETIKNILSKLI